LLSASIWSIIRDAKWKRNILGGTMPNNQSKQVRSRPPTQVSQNTIDKARQMMNRWVMNRWGQTQAPQAATNQQPAGQTYVTTTSGCGCTPGQNKGKCKPESLGLGTGHWVEHLNKVLKHLSGDLNHNNRAKAKEIVKELLILVED